MITCTPTQHNNQQQHTKHTYNTTNTQCGVRPHSVTALCMQHLPKGSLVTKPDATRVQSTQPTSTPRTRHATTTYQLHVSSFSELDCRWSPLFSSWNLAFLTLDTAAGLNWRCSERVWEEHLQPPSPHPTTAKHKQQKNNEKKKMSLLCFNYTYHEKKFIK